MKPRVRLPLWIRMAAVLVLASVVPILGAGYLSIRLLEDSVREEAARSESARALMGGALVREYVSRAREKLTTVSQLLARELSVGKVGSYSARNTLYRDAVVNRLNGLVEPPDIYFNLQYYANEAQPQFVEQVEIGEYQQARFQLPDHEEAQQKQIIDNTQRDLVQVPLASNSPWLAPQLEKNFGFPTLPLSVPVSTAEIPLGVLVAYVDFREVSELLEAVAQKGYYVRLMDGGGELLAKAGKPCAGETMGELRPAGYSDWQVEVREPASRVYASLEQVRGQARLWLGLAVVMALALSFGVSAWIVKPVSTLTAAARQMESGNLKARAGIRRSDEIGRLAAAFDGMAEAMERLDEAKSGFVANVSHELRTPLTSMRLAVANLMDGVCGPLDDAQTSTLSRLRRDLDRLIRMVNDLLEMARLEAGSVVLRLDRFELTALARECVAAFESVSRGRQLQVSVTGQGELEADRSMIQRVLSNLLDNALKFTPEGGRVTVALAEGQFSVSDTGPGVEAEHLFEKFSQGKQEGTKSKGVGLGLAIVKKLVDLHGGTIEVTSTESGATFTVRISGS